MIHELPADGSWVRFDVAVRDRSPTEGGDLAERNADAEIGRSRAGHGVEFAGSSSRRCWNFMRGGPEGRADRIVKLLIQRKYLVTGQNPACTSFQRLEA